MPPTSDIPEMDDNSVQKPCKATGSPQSSFLLSCLLIIQVAAHIANVLGSNAISVPLLHPHRLARLIAIVVADKGQSNRFPDIRISGRNFTSASNSTNDESHKQETPTLKLIHVGCPDRRRLRIVPLNINFFQDLSVFGVDFEYEP